MPTEEEAIAIDQAEVEIEDVTDSLAALALQGPNSREILGQVTNGEVEGLGFFRLTSATMRRKSSVSFMKPKPHLPSTIITSALFMKSVKPMTGSSLL